MRIDREKFLGCLGLASLGVSTKGLLEQSDCLIFKDGKIQAYNGEAMIRVRGIKGVEGVIPPNDLINLLKKITDVEIEVSQEADGQLTIDGKNKKAAIMSEKEVRLDLSEVPSPGEWKEVPKSILTQLRRASETCGLDETWGAATCVHVKRDLIEASDNFRLFRWVGKTCFENEIFLPASSVGILLGLSPDSISMSGGWCHFKSPDAIISIRGRLLENYPDMSKVCEIQGEKVRLPDGLVEVSNRAAVTAEGDGHTIRVSVDIRPGKGRVKSHSKRGWYRESFPVKYSGPDLSFDVHPRVLAEIVKFSPQVIVGKDRIRAVVEEATFVISLRAREVE